MVLDCLYYIFIAFVSICLLSYTYARCSCGQCRSKVCLLGKTIIVTGGNSGIGYEICLDLASRGCQVIIADKDNAEETVLKIKTITNNPNIIYKHLDLSSFKNIRNFATDISTNFSKIDVLINNAGIGAGGQVETEDGIDKTLQVNHYGPFLLTHLLLVFFRKKFSFKTVRDGPRTKYTYADSKMCQLIVAREMARRLRPRGIIVNAVHPGVVRSPIFSKTWPNISDMDPIQILLSEILIYLWGKNCEEGAQTSIYGAIDEEVNEKDIYGEFLWDCKPFYLPPAVKNKDLCDKIYSYSEKLTKLSENEKLQK